MIAKDTKRLSVYMKPEIYKELAEVSEQNAVPVNQLINMAVKYWLEVINDERT